MLSKASNVMGLLAIIIAPLFSLVLPNSITGRLVTAHVELKDAVLLGSVTVLAIIIYSAQALRAATRWIARTPFYRKIDFNYFFLADGTVVIRNAFEYVNGWKSNDQLPREDLIWYKQITNRDLLYRLYERGKLRDRTMTSSGTNRIEAIPQESGRSGDEHRYSWVPSIHPRLGIKERISFVVEMMSLCTETAAFEKGGTKLGFGVNIPTGSAHVNAYAPFGYRFVLVGPELTIRRSDTLEEIATSSSERPIPMVSPDGSILTLAVRRPMLHRRYWVHYRFEALEI